MNHFQTENSASIACQHLLPEKSKGPFGWAYRNFKQWCKNKNTDVSETMLLTYFMEKSATLSHQRDCGVDTPWLNQLFS